MILMIFDHQVAKLDRRTEKSADFFCCSWYGKFLLERFGHCFKRLVLLTEFGRELISAWDGQDSSDAFHHSHADNCSC